MPVTERLVASGQRGCLLLSQNRISSRSSVENKERQLKLEKDEQRTSSGQVSAGSPSCGCGSEDSGGTSRAQVSKA